MHRLFVALRPPPAIRAQLIAAQGGVPGARWQDDEQLHLTLRFIGTVERPLAEDVATALAQVRAPPLTIALAGVGGFEKRGRTDALWAGVTPHDALAALHRKVDAALVRIGLPPEGRAYLPHITLARLARNAGSESEIARWIADHGGLASAAFAVTHFTLFESRLGGEGARYDAIMRWALDG
jgi:2'-5' RNA ligase